MDGAHESRCEICDALVSTGEQLVAGSRFEKPNPIINDIFFVDFNTTITPQQPMWITSFLSRNDDDGTPDPGTSLTVKINIKYDGITQNATEWTKEIKGPSTLGYYRTEAVLAWLPNLYDLIGVSFDMMPEKNNPEFDWAGRPGTYIKKKGCQDRIFTQDNAKFSITVKVYANKTNGAGNAILVDLATITGTGVEMNHADSVFQTNIPTSLGDIGKKYTYGVVIVSKKTQDKIRIKSAALSIFKL